MPEISSTHDQSEVFNDRQVSFDGESDPVESESIRALQLTEMSDEQLAEYFDRENIHNGSHFMTPLDAKTFEELCQIDLPGALIYLREKWSECVDREFIQGFTLVHWVGNSEGGIDNLGHLLGKGVHGVEISTQAYSDIGSLQNTPRWMKAKFGVLIDGRVQLASNADIQTNQWSGLQADDATKRRKYTEWANRLMTSSDNCVSPYEFTVDDWRAVGIVVDADSLEYEKIRELARMYNLPIFDSGDEALFARGGSPDAMRNAGQSELAVSGIDS